MKRTTLYLLLFGFVVTIIPIVAISYYARPILDDFSFGAAAFRSFSSTHSFYVAFKSALQVAKDMYFSWGGDYTRTFLSAINVSVFGEKLYFINPLIVLFLFLFGTYTLSKSVFVDLLKCDRTISIIVFLIISIWSLNFIPSAVQGIYWYNSALYYTGYYGISLVLFSILIRLHLSSSRSKSLQLCVVGSLLAAFVEGGNLSTILTVLVIVTLFFISSLVNKKYKFVFPIEVITIAGFLLNILSPGISLRQTTVENGMSFFTTIFYSIIEAIIDIDRFSSFTFLPVLIIFVLIGLKVVQKSTFSFKHPLPFTILLLGIFTVQFCPSFYSRGFAGESRLVNLAYFQFFWLILIILLYWMGWLNHVLDLSSFYVRFKNAIYQKSKKCIAIWLLLIAIGCIATNSITSITCINAGLSLLSGESKQYSQEYDSQAAYLKTQKGNDVVVSSYTAHPYCIDIKEYEISSDSSAWINQAVSAYYELSSIRSE